MRSLGSHQVVFFQLLPLLFHTNHPLMPGYVDKDCPSGVSDYVPGTETLQCAKKLARSFSLRKGVVRQVDIHSIFLMGSSGSIAQSSDSDFDLWLCHRPGLDEAALTKLRRKAHAIEVWATQLGLEAHFFVMSAETFRSGAVEKLSSESSGTAQRYLLLDEFYRTGLLVEGRPPLWWLVPPDMDSEYDEFVATMVEHRFIDPNNYVDFGSVAKIEPDEFFGATLWQITKAIDAPHKSLLKIMLLEAYANDFPRLDLLSARYKRAIYDGESASEKLDPYLLLFNKVDEYLQMQTDERRLALARRCLYFKVGRSFKQIESRVDWSCEVMAELVSEWQWSQAGMLTLDCRSEWKVDRTIDERKTIVDALTRSYKQLSNFAHENALAGTMSKRDMTILGRKLFTAFEHKAGKIETVNQGISADLSESHLYMEFAENKRSQGCWLLYRQSKNSPGGSPRTPLHRAWSLVEMVAWCHFNGLLAANTRVVVTAAEVEKNSRNVESIGMHLARYFPKALTKCATVDSLGAAAHVLAAGTFANFNASALANVGGAQTVVTTDRSDALSYSAWHANLVEELDYLVVTSWGEILVKKFEGVDGLLACLCEHLVWIRQPRPRQLRPKLSHCCAASYGNTITRRISKLFDDVGRWFSTTDESSRNRFIFRAGDQFHVLLCDKRVPTHEFSGDFAAFLTYLEQPNTHFTRSVVDEHALDDSPVGTVLAANVPGKVQFFYKLTQRVADIYVVDETGALFCDRLDNAIEQTVVSHFAQFFSSVEFRQGAAGSEAKNSVTHSTENRPAIEYNRLSERGKRRYLTERVSEIHEPAGKCFALQVIGERVGVETCFTVYCNGREFSTREFGTSLFEVVSQHVLVMRESEEDYPIYVTDIDLSALADRQLHEQGLTTIHYLQYKKRIEHWLNRFIEKRGRTAPPVWDPAAPA